MPGDVVVFGAGDRVPADLRLLRTSDLRVDESPLTKSMAKFGTQLTVLVVGLAVLLMAVSRLVHGSALIDVGLQAISFAVAAIPEGLPAVMAIALARGVQVMARRNSITRKLGAVETLGSVSVICTDKTGTLTKNEMTVREAFVAAGPVPVSGTGYSPDGDLSGPVSDDPAVRMLAAIADRANESEVREIPATGSADSRWTLVGEPTDGALRVFALKAGHHRGTDDRVSDVPFNSDNKWMAVYDDAPAPADLPPAPRPAPPDGGDAVTGTVLLKGAPDRLLDMCTRELGPAGEVRDLDRGFWDAAIDRLSDQGLRVLAGACRRAGTSESDGDLDENDVALGEFTFVGLYGIIDPPRPEAIEAVARCRAAGIRVKMITGDHAGTASAIAREMGIGDPDPATGAIPAITGPELERMDDAALARAAADHDVFARTSPEHKLRLVGGLQSRGDVVSMTGDGVNDAPALKRADVGVAMGIKGTEATKEAADIVLADDNFSSIAHAVREGRAIYDNLRKTIIYMLPTNGSEALLLGGVTMELFYVALDQGAELGTARTLAVNVLVVGQIWHLFNAPHLREHSFRADLFTTNPVSWIAVGALIALQLLFAYAPFMQAAFGSAPLDAAQWGLIAAIGAALFLVIEGEKALGRLIRR
ncbi:HAD-IC family P-type ATPase [Corynebacterium xerosis]|uniref:HAD-IC family P-type ATPase n=1 Tax=Corynebacterium xerosis TaxID=1725 RepID=UPI0036705173